MFAGGTLGDEHVAVGIDKGAGGNKDDFGHSLTSSTIGNRG